jgi:predicted neuraminidase
MLGKVKFIRLAAAFIVIVFVALVGVATPADQTVNQMADGVVRASRFKGAMEAYLPIIAHSNHAANLLALPNGDLLCFWFAGTGEGQSGVSIAMSRLDNGSSRWSQPVILSHHPGWSDQNPVPFQAPDGRLWLFHTSQEAGKGQTTAIVYDATSDDLGHTWTVPEILFSEPGTFIRQHLVVFNNEWLLPAYHSAAAGITENAQNDVSIVKISKDNGKTWSGCEVPSSGGLVQMDIVKLSEDHLAAFFRSRYGDWIYASHSANGCEWSAPVATQLPNNNSSIQAVRLRDGHLIMVFNNAQAASTRAMPRTAARNILSVALSPDGGKTWPWVRDVQDGNEPPTFSAGEHSEYSYPSVTQSTNGMIQMAFTFRRETIKYMIFDESWIKQGTTKGVFTGDPSVPTSVR